MEGLPPIRRSNEDCVFFAGPCACGSPCNRLSKRNSPVTAHEINMKASLYWKFWEVFSQGLLKVINLDAVALLKLPRGGDYSNDKRMKFMINGTESHIHDFDGCVHGLTTQFAEGTPQLKKPWRIVSWGSGLKSTRSVPEATTMESVQVEKLSKVTQTCTDEIVDIILKIVHRRMSAPFSKKVVDDQKVCNNCQHEQTKNKRRKKKKVVVALPEHHIPKARVMGECVHAIYEQHVQHPSDTVAHFRFNYHNISRPVRPGRACAVGGWDTR